MDVLRKIFPFLLLLFGFAGGYFLAVRNSNNAIQKAHQRAKEVERVNSVKQDSITKLHNKALDSVLKLDSLLTQKNRELAAQRTKIILKPQINELENAILDKGPDLYGESHTGNSRRANIASYGANAIVEVEYSRRIIKEQKVQIIYVGQILELENEIRVEYQKGLELAAKKCNDKQLKKGLIVGGGSMLLLLLLIL